MQMAQAQATFT